MRRIPQAMRRSGDHVGPLKTFSKPEQKAVIYTMNFRARVRIAGGYYRAVLERQLIRDDGQTVWSTARIFGQPRSRLALAQDDAQEYARRESFPVV